MSNSLSADTSDAIVQQLDQLLAELKELREQQAGWIILIRRLLMHSAPDIPDELWKCAHDFIDGK